MSIQHYIRFGDWPKNERSQVGEQLRLSRSWLYQAIGEDQAEFEDGVSVYEATWDDAKRRWVIPTIGTDSYIPSLCEFIEQRRPIFLLTGDDVGVGTDGEPLIRNIKLIKELKYSDIYNDHCYDEDAILSEESAPIKSQPVNFILKRAGELPEFLQQALTLKNIQQLLGGYFRMVRISRTGVVMLVLELDFPEQNTDLNLYLPQLGEIFGPVIITAIKTEEEMMAFRRTLPWPWYRADLELEEQPIAVPGEEFRSLSDKEAKHWANKLMEWHLPRS